MLRRRSPLLAAAFLVLGAALLADAKLAAKDLALAPIPADASLVGGANAQCARGAREEGCPDSNPCCYSVTTPPRVAVPGVASGCRRDDTATKSKVIMNMAGNTPHKACCQQCRAENRNPPAGKGPCNHYIYWGAHFQGQSPLKKCVLLYDLAGMQVDLSGRKCPYQPHVKSAEVDSICDALTD